MIAQEQTTGFSKLSVKDFRRLKSVQLDLRPLTVLIGANGVGKTSILDVLMFLARSARGELNSTISDLSGLSALITYGSSSELCLSISKAIEGYAPLDYDLCLMTHGIAYEVSKEVLSQLPDYRLPSFAHIDSQGADIKYYDPEQKKLIRPTWQHNPLETSLSQVPKMFREPEEFRQRLASTVLYHFLNVEPRSPVRLPQPMRPAMLPGANGEDLVSCLFYLRETNWDRFEAIEDSLRATFPTFERLEFPPVAAGTLALTWRDSSFSTPLFMHQLSEGMLRFLWLATLLQSSGLTALTLLDEPEVSLHPELLRLLAGLLREASHRTQLVVATHSDRLIKFLNPYEVVVMDSTEDGFTQARWADELDLDEWLTEYSLDELWLAGRIGARE